MKRFWIILLSLIVTVSASAQSVNAHLAGRTVIGSLAKIDMPSTANGIVVVTIKVDPYGNVVEAVPGGEGTTITDKDLWTAARNAAMKAHFTQNADAPAVQKGTISYVFKDESTQKASSKDVLKFMGIPVDGTEYQVRNQLIKKGFKFNYYSDLFTGEFNGKPVKVSIHTNHKLVDRIYIRFPSYNEHSIRNEYNTLLNQFLNSGKYVSALTNKEIPNEESIAEKIKSNEETYEALFYYLNSERDPDLYVETLSLRREILDIKDSEELEKVNALSDQLDSLSDEEYNKHPDSVIIEEFASKMAKKLFLFGECVDYLSDGHVWFTIHEDGSKYFISLYYDNLHNRPHGEDL